LLLVRVSSATQGGELSLGALSSVQEKCRLRLGVVRIFVSPSEIKIDLSFVASLAFGILPDSLQKESSWEKY